VLYGLWINRYHSIEVEVTVEVDAPENVSPEEVALVETQLADLIKQMLMQTDTEEE
jgi:hypothetical protein